MTICDAKMKPSHAPSLPLSSTHFGYTRRYVGIRKAVQLIWRGLRQYIYHCYDGICWKWSASASSSPSCWHRCCWILTRASLFILVPSDFITRWSHNMTLVHCRPSSLPRYLYLHYLWKRGHHVYRHMTHHVFKPWSRDPARFEKPYTFSPPIRVSSSASGEHMYVWSKDNGLTTLTVIVSFLFALAGSPHRMVCAAFLSDPTSLFCY